MHTIFANVQAEEAAATAAAESAIDAALELIFAPPETV